MDHGENHAATFPNSSTTLGGGQFQNLLESCDEKPLLLAKEEIIRP